VTTCANCGATLPTGARFCPSCATPAVGEPEPSEERKLATVLFADLVGSTELGGSQDPERMRVLLDRFYDAMAAEIEAAGGTVEKFIGDAVMAAFGAPAALGAVDRIEVEAPRWLNERTYVQPFALRALGVARADGRLLDEATTRFRENGLDWRADETLLLRIRGRPVGS